MPMTRNASLRIGLSPPPVGIRQGRRFWRLRVATVRGGGARGLPFCLCVFWAFSWSFSLFPWPLQSKIPGRAWVSWGISCSTIWTPEQSVLRINISKNFLRDQTFDAFLSLFFINLFFSFIANISSSVGVRCSTLAKFVEKEKRKNDYGQARFEGFTTIKTYIWKTRTLNQESIKLYPLLLKM